MKRLIKTFAIILYSLISFAGVCQQQSTKEWLQVLKQERIGKQFVFDNSRDGNYDRISFRYLGKVTTSGGSLYKLISYSGLYGSSPTGTGGLLVFDSKNNYLGRYVFGIPKENAVRVEGNAVILLPDPGCDSKNVFRLMFNKGIPKEFFWECKDGMGNIVGFVRSPK